MLSYSPHLPGAETHIKSECREHARECSSKGNPNAIPAGAAGRPFPAPRPAPSIS
jgi:hypothetical protein